MMIHRLERKIIIAVGIICTWFGATTFHYVQILSSSNLHLERPGPLQIRKRSFRSVLPLDVGNIQTKNIVKQVRFVSASEAEEITNHQAPFPASIKNEEWETIIHPAVIMAPRKVNTAEAEEGEEETLAGTEEEKQEKTNSENHQLKVPKFWSPPMFQPDIRTYFGDYGEKLLTPEQASRIGSYTPAIKDYDIKVGDAQQKIIKEENASGKQEEVLQISVDDQYDMPPDEVQLLETIFVSVASYRDYRCPHTIRQLFKQAKYPERIRVVVVDQLDLEEDTPCTEPQRSCEDHPDDILCKHAHRIDTFQMDATLAVGPVFARHIGNRLYRGEYYAMQSDAHMEFVVGWDEDLIGQWKAAKNEMAVITTYVSDVEDHYDKKNGTASSAERPIMCATDFEEDYYNEALSFLMHGQQPEGEPDLTGEPSLHPLWAAGFSFSRGHFVVQVPYDQYLPMVFQGEEISISVRGFTYGYDFYAPERSVIFHYYHTDPNNKKRNVKTFWEHADEYEGVGTNSKARLIGIIEMLGTSIPVKKAEVKQKKGADTEEVEGSGSEDEEEEEEGEIIDAEEEKYEYKNITVEWNAIEEKKYGLGQVRTVQKYMDTFGIHLDKRKVEKRLCQFVGKNMNAVFTKHMRSDGMGIDYNQIEYKFVDPKKYGKTWSKYM